MAYKFNPFSGTLDYYQAANGSDVTGIAPTNIGAIARWADTTAHTIENSPNTNVQDGGAIEAQLFITMQQISAPVVVNQDECAIAPALNITPTGSIDLSGGGSLMILGG